MHYDNRFLGLSYMLLISVGNTFSVLPLGMSCEYSVDPYRTRLSVLSLRLQGAQK